MLINPSTQIATLKEPIADNTFTRTSIITPQTANPMGNVFRRLRAVGLTTSYVRKMILPDWWDDKIAENPAGLAEGLGFLSRHLGLDIATLRDPGRPVAFRNFGACKFKKSQNVTEDDLSLSRAMATRAAQIVNGAVTEPPVSPPVEAAEIRREILGQNEPWVNLQNLAEYCWSLGIPVVHLSSIASAKRPDGLAVRVGGRPIIVLCKKESFTSRMLFLLAHELGHIALGHIDEDGVLVDESMKDNVQDQEESAANSFAIELLTGAPKSAFRATGRWLNAQQLADAAVAIGREQRIDPGHIVLNYAHTMGSRFWPVANAALKLIEPRGEGLTIVRRLMAEHLDWSSLPEDSSEFLMRLSQAERSSDLSNG